MSEDGTVMDLPIPMSDAYRDRRRSLLQEEKELRDHRERVAELRRGLPPGPVMDAGYVFVEGDPDMMVEDPSAFRETRLEGLFNSGSDQLFIYHMMFDPEWDEGCHMCSMWLDGLNGVAHHIRETTSFAAPSRPDRSWTPGTSSSKATRTWRSRTRVPSARPAWRRFSNR